MTAKLYNLARMTTATTGTGTITLGSAATVNGTLYLTFAQAGIADGDIVMYGIADSGSEVGYGTYTAAGTTLTRTVLRSTNSNNAISLTGSAQVFILGLAENAILGPITPQGRLTLSTGTPVMSTSVTAATTVYYTPYLGDTVPIYNGAFFVNTEYTELSQATTDSTKSPAAATTNSNYDMFVWNDSGTIRCTRGPAWSSSTARGTGAGTTELQLVQGIWTNKVAITNGPGANLGTYVGTIRTNGSSQVDFAYGSSAAGGGASSIFVWNMYNRVAMTTSVIDSTATWSYTSATVRPADNSTSNRITFVSGLAEDGIWGVSSTRGDGGGGNGTLFGIAMDSTTAFDVNAVIVASGTMLGNKGYSPQLGLHYLQALEGGNGISASTIYGSPYFGLTMIWRC